MKDKNPWIESWKNIYELSRELGGEKLVNEPLIWLVISILHPTSEPVIMLADFFILVRVFESP